MKLTAKFHWDDYVKNYEIDYHNDLSLDEKINLSKKLDISIEHVDYCFYKNGNEWNSRISGMTFNIKNSTWYPIMKEHLDKEFLKFTREEKLKQIDGK